MPLTPYLKGAVFDPRAIEAMNIAFTAVCASRQLTNPNPQTEIAARAIIDIARNGERDPAKLQALALAVLQASNQRIA